MYIYQSMKYEVKSEGELDVEDDWIDPKERIRIQLCRSYGLFIYLFKLKCFFTASIFVSFLLLIGHHKSLGMLS